MSTVNRTVPETGNLTEWANEVGAEIMYRLCEVDSIVKGCNALIDAAGDHGEGRICSSDELTAVSYLLTMASGRLMDHWWYVDAEFARLRSEDVPPAQP